MCAMLSPILAGSKYYQLPRRKHAAFAETACFRGGRCQLTVPSGDPRKHGTHLKDFESLTVQKLIRYPHVCHVCHAFADPCWLKILSAPTAKACSFCRDIMLCR